MPLIDTDSIILKTYNLAEADKIVLFLTRDHGVIRGVAKGAKRLKSRFGSGLEVFSVVRLSYFEKEARELVSIQHADLLNSYFEAASDPLFFGKFSYLADLLVSFSQPNDPNETLYRMTHACLEAAVRDINRLDAIGLYFEMWLLRLSGLLPDWSACAECRSKFGENARASLQANYQLVCPKCKRSPGGTAVEWEHRQIYASARTMPPAEFADWASQSPEKVAELSLLTKKLVSQALGRDVNEGRSMTAK